MYSGKSYTENELGAPSSKKEINQKILELLAYSFKEGRDIIPYMNLTPREQSIITEADYELIHEMIQEGKLEIKTKLSVREVVKISVTVSLITSFIVGIVKGIILGLC